MGAIVLTKENARLQKEILSLSPNGDDIVTVGTNNYDAASIVRKDRFCLISSYIPSSALTLWDLMTTLSIQNDLLDF